MLFPVFKCRFWTTVCKTVRPMLSDRLSVCLSVCLPVMFVTLVHCDQTVGRFKMKLRMQIDLGPSHIVLDGDLAPLPKKGAEPPIFGPYLLWPNGCMDQDATWYGGRPRLRRLCMRWEPRSLPKKGAEPHKFSAHIYCSQTAGWIKMALGMEVGLNSGDFVLDGDLASLPKKRVKPPPKSSAYFYYGQTAAWIKMPLGTVVGLCLRDIVRWGPSSPSPKGTQPANFRPMSIVAKRLHGLRCHLVRR